MVAQLVKKSLPYVTCLQDQADLPLNPIHILRPYFFKILFDAAVVVTYLVLKFSFQNL